MIGKMGKMAIAALALSCGLMVPANAQNHDVTLNTLRVEVETAANTGRISRQGALELSTTLDEIAHKHAAYASDGLVTAERAQLDTDIANVSARFHDLVVVGGGSRWYSRFGSSTIPVTVPNNLSAQIAQMRAEVNQASISGRISPREASRLQRDLDRVARSELQMTTSGNRLTRGEFNALSRQLSSVRRGLNRFM